MRVANFKIRYRWILGLFLLLCIALPTYAGELDYTPLAPFTQEEIKSPRPVALDTYLPFLFNLLLGLSALLAIVMIVIGGVTYITTDVFSQKGYGKSIITNALYGLLFVISSYMILYTINPDLLSFKLYFDTRDFNKNGWGILGLPSAPGGGGGTFSGRTPDYGTGPVGETAARALLSTESGGQISINNPCSDGQPNCQTQIGNVQAEVFQGVKRLWEDCQYKNGGSCPVVITGGNEPHGGTNDPHAAGYVVDIRSSPLVDAQMRAYIGLSSNPAPSTSGDGYTANLPGGPYRVYYEGDHWHFEKRR